MRILGDIMRRVIRAFEEALGSSPKYHQGAPVDPNPLAWLGQKGKGHARHQAGWRAEDYAAKHLRGLGYHILGRNVYTGNGEIDIVAEHDSRLVFIEVRSRSQDSPVRPSSTVTLKKTRQILRCAKVYMRKNGLRPEDVNPRYDIAEVDLDENDQPCSFAVLQAAVTDDPRPRR